MDIDQSISYCFDEYIKNKFPNEEIKNFLLKHERRHLIENNLKRELKKSHKFIKNGLELRILINDFIRMFCKIALNVKEMEINARGTTNRLQT